MTIERIKCFVTLAEHLHFGRAADILYISQSTLSYNIAQLEEELRVSLFVRNNRKVILSSAGVKLLPIAKELLEKSDQMLMLAKQSADEEKGVTNLNLCLDRAFSRVNLLDLTSAVQNLRASIPSLRINIHFREFDELLRETENMVQDLSFGYLREDEQVSNLLNAIPLYEDEMVLVHNLPNVEGKSAFELLSNYPIYLLDHDPRWTDYFCNYILSMGIYTNPLMMPTFNDMYTHVRLGGGVTISNKTDAGVVNGGLDQDFQYLEFEDKYKCKVHLCAFWAKGNYNYAIMELMSRLNIDPSVGDAIW